jgi:hypothetical protein
MLYDLQGGNCMKKQYAQPDVKLIRLSTEDIISASDNEVFVDGGDLFGNS